MAQRPMFYHALWMGRVSWSDTYVAKRHGADADPVLHVRARLSLAAWNEASSEVSRLPLQGQLVRGGAWAGVAFDDNAYVEVQRIPSDPRSWRCTVRASACLADGPACQLEIAPLTLLPDKKQLGEGERAAVRIVDPVSGQLLASGECHMSLRFFLHHFSGMPLP